MEVLGCAAIIIFKREFRLNDLLHLLIKANARSINVFPYQCETLECLRTSNIIKKPLKRLAPILIEVMKSEA